ncbi:hypothetical protein GGS23DRAFT_469311 [Durotheca rogersii]|uniref:uncharacterized protein n=1 Tax=Durotheca rogersii TaxID=419775 RepID=UPI002220A730|nr:uncharacterized protein GGS23DRAFT_469311 [Durotheca rogersii]KAI5864934.1 hypothetical protein GGS23DRAFT_469311 [Durotheca rogersii]
MFGRRFEPPLHKSFSKSQKLNKSSSSFSKTHGVSKNRHEPRPHRRPATATSSQSPHENALSPTGSLTPSIVTLVVGKDQRIFAAHEDVLRASPWFQQALAEQFMAATDLQGGKRVYLPDEEPEIFSSVLEYLYKGDYYPRLVHNRRRNSWEIERPAEGEEGGGGESTIYHHAADGDILKDTIVYCAAEKYGLEELKRVSLRKQGLQSGIQCSTILASARYAYAHTPDTDSKLRAHYLALIIRSRSTFKRSGTMQLEMFNGGTQLFFDLFVALCNHVDDISGSAQNTPRSDRRFF